MLVPLNWNQTKENFDPKILADSKISDGSILKKFVSLKILGFNASYSGEQIRRDLLC